jgi:hypothetical protein
MSAQDLTLQKLIRGIPNDYSIIIDRCADVVTVSVVYLYQKPNVLAWHQHISPGIEYEKGAPMDKIVLALREALAYIEDGGTGWELQK